MFIEVWKQSLNHKPGSTLLIHKHVDDTGPCCLNAPIELLWTVSSQAWLVWLVHSVHKVGCSPLTHALFLFSSEFLFMTCLIKSILIRTEIYLLCSSVTRMPVIAPQPIKVPWYTSVFCRVRFNSLCLLILTSSDEKVVYLLRTALVKERSQLKETARFSGRIWILISTSWRL